MHESGRHPGTSGRYRRDPRAVGRVHPPRGRAPRRVWYPPDLCRTMRSDDQSSDRWWSRNFPRCLPDSPGLSTSRIGSLYGDEYATARTALCILSITDRFRGALPETWDDHRSLLVWGRDRGVPRIIVENRLSVRVVNYYVRNYGESGSYPRTWRISTRFLVVLHPVVVTYRRIARRPTTKALRVGTTYSISWTPFAQGLSFSVDRRQLRRFVLT